ncbi:hypothetical protein MANI_020788 [Metarhizium anisopliae]|nr:hypothetical protein MANI_020788 [Metarhizium anisopliae]
MSRMNRSQSTAEAQDPISHFEQIFSIQGENKTATVYKTSKGVIKFERSFIFWHPCVMISWLASDTNNATGAGPIDDAAKNKAIEIVLEQYPEFQGPAIPET